MPRRAFFRILTTVRILCFLYGEDAITYEGVVLHHFAGGPPSLPERRVVVVAAARTPTTIPAPDDIPPHTFPIETLNPMVTHAESGTDFVKKASVLNDTITFYATEDFTNAQIQHCAHIAAELLDNDEDGQVDNAVLGARLKQRSATVVLVPQRNRLVQRRLIRRRRGLQHQEDEELRQRNALHSDYNSPGQQDDEGVVYFLGRPVIISTTRTAQHQGTPANIKHLDDHDERRLSLPFDIDRSIGIFPEDISPGYYSDMENVQFDATLEEIFHLITDAGYAKVYPSVFGTSANDDDQSQMTKAMDLARGGRQVTPAGLGGVEWKYDTTKAWYFYDDATCDYACMGTEYLYWGVSTFLNLQSSTSRCSQIANEWTVCTPSQLETKDPTLYKLLTTCEYKLPINTPNGIYTPKTGGHGPMYAFSINATVSSCTTKEAEGGGWNQPQGGNTAAKGAGKGDSEKGEGKGENTAGNNGGNMGGKNGGNTAGNNGRSETDGSTTSTSDEATTDGVIASSDAASVLRWPSGSRSVQVLFSTYVALIIVMLML